MNCYTFYEQTIIENISDDVLDISPSDDLFDLINTVYKCFVDEHGYNIERLGELNAFKEWLSGLPTVLSVPFYNGEIIENYEKFSELTLNDISAETLINTYFERLAIAFFVLKNNL